MNRNKKGRHSVPPLSKEIKLHPKRLRKLLRASGLLPADADALADGNCLFDAGRGSGAAMEAAAATLFVRKAGEYLNAPQVQRDMLCRASLIVPRVSGSDQAVRVRGPGRFSGSAAGLRRAGEGRRRQVSIPEAPGSPSA